jgi:hypothetical protein
MGHPMFVWAARRAADHAAQVAVDLAITLIDLVPSITDQTSSEWKMYFWVLCLCIVSTIRR